MNAFSKPTGPSLFSARELAQAQKPMRDHTPGQMYWASKVSNFCTPIPSQAAQDKSNAINNSCQFFDQGDADREALNGR